MDILVRQTLDFIKQEFSPHDTLPISQGDLAYFHEEKTLQVKVVDEEKKPIMTEEKLPAFVLEPTAIQKKEEMEEIRNLVKNAAPHLPLQLTIPDDSRAKKISNLWKEHLGAAEVIILSHGQTGDELKFLQNVAGAISSILKPAKVIDAIRFEKENKWPIFFSSFQLKLIIAPDMHLWKKTNLSTFYKENPVSSLHFLEKTPLLILAPISHYLKTTHLKKQLWKTIVSHLSS